MLGLLLMALLATPSWCVLPDRSFRRYYNLTINNKAYSQSFKVTTRMGCAGLCLSGGGNCGYYQTNVSHCSIFPANNTLITKDGGATPFYTSPTLYSDHGYQPYDHGRTLRTITMSPSATYVECKANCSSPFAFGTPFALRSAEDTTRLKQMLAPNQSLFVGLYCIRIRFPGPCINYTWEDGTSYSGTYGATLVNASPFLVIESALAKVDSTGSNSTLELKMYATNSTASKDTNVGCLCQAEEFYP